jgi:hypothetical protein
MGITEHSGRFSFARTRVHRSWCQVWIAMKSVLQERIRRVLSVCVRRSMKIVPETAATKPAQKSGWRESGFQETRCGVSLLGSSSFERLALLFRTFPYSTGISRVRLPSLF